MRKGVKMSEFPKMTNKFKYFLIEAKAFGIYAFYKSIPQKSPIPSKTLIFCQNWHSSTPKYLFRYPRL